MDRFEELDLADELRTIAINLELMLNEMHGDGTYDHFSTFTLQPDVKRWHNERLGPFLGTAVTRLRAIAGDVLGPSCSSCSRGPNDGDEEDEPTESPVDQGPEVA